MRRYEWLARGYDLLSGEPVYRRGREVAISRLALSPGERVLDLGCGTGLNLPALTRAVGPAGRVTGLDVSPAMLAAARRRRLPGLDLVLADAQRLSEQPPAELLTAGFDVLLATYTLSLMPDPDRAWAGARTLLRPGARVGVVDMQPPHGRSRWARPLARAACWAGGADLAARPWRLVGEDLVSTVTTEHRGGHVVVTTGTWLG